jgi:hypothetical protein
MALLSGNRIAWTYTADDGSTYRVAAMKAMTDQDKLGGTAAAGTLQEKPSAIKMRRVTVSNGTYSRVLPCYEPGAPIVTAGETVTANAAGDSRSLTSNGGFIPEGGPRKNVTKQSS